MSLHRALSNGWWNKLKPTNTATELKIDRFPSIYSNSETIPTKIIQKSNQLSLVANNQYYVQKGLADGFKMDKDEVERVRNASLPHGNDAPDNVIAGATYDEPNPSSDGGKPPPNLPSELPTSAPPATETVAVKQPRFQDVEGVDDYYERIRNPPFDNSTVNVLDETGRVKDALSDPSLISHVDKLYEDMKTGVKITKKTGGRGAGGGRGVEMTFNGKKLDDLTPADGEALKSALTKLKRVDDEATGKVGRRIHADYRRLDSALKGLIVTASVGGFVKTEGMSKDGKAVLEEAVAEAKKDLTENPPKVPKLVITDLYNKALAELRRVKADGEVKGQVIEEIKLARDEAKEPKLVVKGQTLVKPDLFEKVISEVKSLKAEKAKEPKLVIGGGGKQVYDDLYNRVLDILSRQKGKEVKQPKLVVTDLYTRALAELNRVKAEESVKAEARDALQLAKDEADDEGDDDDEEDGNEPNAGGGGATVARTVASEPAEGMAPIADKKVPDISIVDKEWMTGKHRPTLLRLASSIDIDNPEQYQNKGLKKKILLRKAEILQIRIKSPDAYKIVSPAKRSSKSGGGASSKSDD